MANHNPDLCPPEPVTDPQVLAETLELIGLSDACEAFDICRECAERDIIAALQKAATRLREYREAVALVCMYQPTDEQRPAMDRLLALNRVEP